MAGPSTKWMGALSRSGSAGAWAPRALLLVTLLTASAVIAGACSGENSGAPGPQDGTGGPDGGVSTGAGMGDPCVDGEERECHITVGEHEGVLTCLDGIRRCEDGRYGSCEGSMTMRRSPFGAAPRGTGESGYPRPLANSEASDGGLCATNPCDPTCQSFEETPDGGPIDLSSTGTTYTWSVGDINELPELVSRQGTHQPCTTSEDCQFDQYCDNPARGTCAHDMCASGPSLLSTCSGCVSKVCNANPTCCTQTLIPANCGHDACQVAPGAATHMTPTCGDPCIANICATNPRCCQITCTDSTICEAVLGTGSACAFGNECLPPPGGCPAGTVNVGGRCQGTWSSTCVNLVATQCPGKTCGGPAPAWSATCVSLAESLCDTTCDTDPGCAHDKCYTGARLNAAACGSCVSQVCTAMPSCCAAGGEWTDACVDLVGSLCGETCPQQGLCKAFLPNETDPTCAGADLTVGVPCGGTIPVCNRGNTPAPAGIEIHRYPANAGQLPSSAPGRVLSSCNPTGGTLACTTAQPIAPGECISVAGCTGVADGMELIVNPPGAAHVTECQCANNGSIYQSAMCESPGCIATASVSLVRPVTLFVALDASTSMRRSLGSTTDNTINTRWNPAINALRAFFSDPKSAGLGVAFRFWPDNNPGNCNDTTSCSHPTGDGCANARVPFDGSAARRLTEDAAPTDQQELALTNALTAITPNGNTPMYPALNGATTWANNYKDAHPEEEVAVVFVTDGIPSHCDTVPNHIADLARNAFQNHGVRVHAVGFGNSNAEIINNIADRGGGQAYNLLEGATLQGGLRDALVSIRGEALPCDVTVPLAGVSDPNSVSVVHVDRMGVEATLTKRAGLATCGDGWYFADATYTSVKLCPQTCSDIRENPGGKVRAIVPCVTTSLTPITTDPELYHGLCPPGTKTQWGYLRYRTVTPGDSSVEFLVRTADDPDDLDAMTEVSVATAHRVPTDTQVCDESSTPTCAIDLFSALGELPDARREYLDLQMTLNPTSTGGGGVQVQDWEITYSCPDTE
ncbi:vWA domain-containing protein [Sorangium sp. So ce1389]|uniref:vWA domain-containing protein n=1 Tax=Sorangium sp. So ce1389 TaxID=3133336 RepID=UPI003F60B14D